MLAPGLTEEDLAVLPKSEKRKAVLASGDKETRDNGEPMEQRSVEHGTYCQCDKLRACYGPGKGPNCAEIAPAVRIDT